MSTPYNDRKLARVAASAALLGIPSDEATDAFLTEELRVPPPTPPPPTPPNHAKEQAALDDVEQQLTDRPSHRLLAIGLAALFAFEVIGCSLLMETIGLENPTRLIFGIMLAAGLFVLTSVGVRLRATHPRLFTTVMAGYVIVVLAITILRWEDMPGSDDASTLHDLAEAVLMTCTTAGLAWLAELLIRPLIPMVPLLRKRALHRRRIADANRTHQRAIAAGARTVKRAEQWEANAEQLRAAFRGRYAMVHKVMEDVQQQRPIAPRATAKPRMPMQHAPRNGGTP